MTALGGRKRIAITGAAGYLAQRIIPSLKEEYDLVLLDRKPHPDGVSIDLANPHALEERLVGCEFLIHLAYQPPTEDERKNPTTAWEREHENVELAAVVFEAAQVAGVRRVIFASSVHADDIALLAALNDKDKKLNPTSRPHAVSAYGWSKIAIEELAYLFAANSLDQHMEFVGIRFGRLRPLERDIAMSASRQRDRAIFLDQHDLNTLMRCALTAKLSHALPAPWAIVYGVSHNPENIFDLAYGEEILGYRPRTNEALSV